MSRSASGACASLSVFDGSPAKRAGIRAGDLISAVDGHVDRRGLRPTLDRADQGQARHQRAPHWPHAGRQAAHAASAPRADHGPGRRDRSLRTVNGRTLGVGRAGELHLGRARRAARRDRQAARRGAPRGSCSTCAATAAACSTRRCSCRASSSPTARSSPPRGRARPKRDLPARPATRSAQGPGGGAGRPRHRVGLRDRHRRAAGAPPRRGRGHAHVRQGRLPGGRAALQRRRARHHRRAVLPPQRDATSAARAIKPDVRAPDVAHDNRATRRSTRRSTSALRTGGRRG